MESLRQADTKMYVHSANTKIFIQQIWRGLTLNSFTPVHVCVCVRTYFCQNLDRINDWPNDKRWGNCQMPITAKQSDIDMWFQLETNRKLYILGSSPAPVASTVKNFERSK